MKKDYPSFKRTIKTFYKKHGRNDLPWRKATDPYKILVSEIMLQQTQVDRVIPKYKEFLKAFPTLTSLAKASNTDLLFVWKGLGYNRRAINLKRTAEEIRRKHKGVFPKDYDTLLSLPGIGPATAGDVLAFSWNIPVPIIETNIRTVYIHHFFPKTKRKITDKEILSLVEKTLDSNNPREWYWALMDYGSHLKKTGNDKNKKSASYKKQSVFKGSNRELRSHILTYILQHPYTSKTDIQTHFPKQNVDTNLTKMIQEGLIKKTSKGYRV